VPGPAGVDATRCPVVLTGGVEEPATVQAQMDQLPADGAHRDLNAFTGQLVGDAAGGELAVAA
jgi:hypothetical protein